MSRRRRHADAVLLAALAAATFFIASTVRAQAPKPVVMVVGTYHMANPGRDRNNVMVDDHLAPARQAQLEEVAAMLASFRPTKIALEVPVARDSALNAQYAADLAGTLPPDPSEVQQVGFRLAKRLGHARVYATDYKRDLDMASAWQFAQQHGQMARLASGEAKVKAFIARGQRDIPKLTVAQILRETNADDVDSLHGMYLQLATIGADTNYVGADVTGDWYVRNLRIFVNIARLAQPGDRVLVLYGSGHRPLLNEYLRQSQLFDVVEVVDYLR
jgi:hypothetical protein